MEKDAVMYKTDDEVVKEEKECNGDEPISMVSTEDLQQEAYNEEDKNELLKYEISMQLQVSQQLTYPHNKNLFIVHFRERQSVGGYCS